MISRHFLRAQPLVRLWRVFNTDVPSVVTECRKVNARVFCQSYQSKCLLSVQFNMEDNNNNTTVCTTADKCTKQQKSKTLKKEKKAKKGPKKASESKQKGQESENLLSDLPFADAELGGTESSVKKKKRKRGVKAEEEDAERKKKETTRPNYFVSVPITNPQIKQAVEDVQKQVLMKDSRLSRALIPVDTLHITLLVTHLSTQDQVDLAASTLSELESPLNALLSGRRLVLPFCGIGHFRQEVYFVRIAEGEHLNTLALIAESVRKAFEERGITSADDTVFKPHLTLLKLSRAPTVRRQGVKKLDPALFSEFESRVFGDECVCRVDLCSMLKKKSADGYYHCEKSVRFSVKKASSAPDDEELLSLSKRLVEDAVLRAVQQYMEETQQNGAAHTDQAHSKLNSTK